MNLLLLKVPDSTMLKIRRFKTRPPTPNGSGNTSGDRADGSAAACRCRRRATSALLSRSRWVQSFSEMPRVTWTSYWQRCLRQIAPASPFS